MESIQLEIRRQAQEKGLPESQVEVATAIAGLALASKGVAPTKPEVLRDLAKASLAASTYKQGLSLAWHKVCCLAKVESTALLQTQLRFQRAQPRQVLLFDLRGNGIQAVLNEAQMSAVFGRKEGVPLESDELFALAYAHGFHKHKCQTERDSVQFYAYRYEVGSSLSQPLETGRWELKGGRDLLVRRDALVWTMEQRYVHVEDGGNLGLSVRKTDATYLKVVCDGKLFLIVDMEKDRVMQLECQTLYDHPAFKTLLKKTHADKGPANLKRQNAMKLE